VINLDLGINALRRRSTRVLTRPPGRPVRDRKIVLRAGEAAGSCFRRVSGGELPSAVYALAAAWQPVEAVAMGFLDDLPAPEPAPPRRQHPWEPPDAEFPGNVPLDTSCSGGPTRSRWRSQARYASPREAYDASICQTETLPTLFTGRISPAMPTRSALGRCRASARGPGLSRLRSG